MKFEPGLSQIRVSSSRKGFTRTELLAVLVVTCIVAMLHRSTFANEKNRSRSITCLSNLRELTLGWLSYADDNGGALIPNNLGGDNIQPTASNWISGWLGWENSSANTNIQHLIDPRYALIAPYIRTNVSLFKCPEDIYTSPIQQRQVWALRVRSYSMNYAMGPGNDFKRSFATETAIFSKLSDLTELKPEEAIVLLDEHPDSINDPMFLTSWREPRWVDLPGSFHHGSGSFSFADGHVDLHRWIDSRTVRPVRYNFDPFPLTPNNPDLEWVRKRSSVLKFQQ
ncbi:MAG: type II secretion system protein [Verrucomicrobiales bacterium]